MRKEVYARQNGIYQNPNDQTYWVLYRDPFRTGRLVPLTTMLLNGQDYEQIFMDGLPAGPSNKSFLGYHDFGPNSVFDIPTGKVAFKDLAFTGTVLVNEGHLNRLENNSIKLEQIQRAARELFKL